MFYCSGIVAYSMGKGNVYGCQIYPICTLMENLILLVIFRGENTLLEWNWCVFDRFSR